MKKFLLLGATVGQIAFLNAHAGGDGQKSKIKSALAFVNGLIPKQSVIRKILLTHGVEDLFELARMDGNFD